MSEEQQEELSLEDAIEAEAAREAEKVDDKPDILADIPDDDKPYAKGWNPNGSKTLEQFINDGKWMEKVDILDKKLKSHTAETNERLQMQAKLLTLQHNEAMKAALAKKRDAVNMSDMEALDEAQNEIDELKAIAPDKVKDTVAVDEREDEIAREWNAANSWINVADINSPMYDPESPDYVKANHAQKFIQKQYAQGMKNSELVKLLDTEIASKFPVDKKPAAPKHLASNSRAASAKGAPSFSDLTREEKDFYEKTSSMWATKEAYAQAALDARDK